MMGRSHLLLGSAGFLGVGAPALHLLGTNLGPAQLAAGTVVCAGASMLPDMDHPQATVSRSLGVVTQKLAKGIAKISGGHRHGTHSILFAILVTLGLKMALDAATGPWVALGICFFFASLVVKVMTETHGAVSAVLAAIVAATLISVAPHQEWIYFSVGLGCLLHDLGDILTPESCPLLWPLVKTKFSLHVIGRTGDRREWAIGILCSLAICYLGWINVYQPLWTARAQHSQRGSVVAGQLHRQSGLDAKLQQKRERLTLLNRKIREREQVLSHKLG